MTSGWITKAAEEAHRGPRMHVGTVTDREVQAFIAGVELGLAKAAEVADEFDWKTYMQPICQDCSYVATEEIAAAIRALGSDENEE